MIKKNNTPKSKEFLEKKEAIALRLNTEKVIHRMKMEQLAYLRESDQMHHERELERGRIKSAEIRKTLIHKGMLGR